MAANRLTNFPMIRFVHTADWQIGMKAAHVGAVGERVREERLAAGQRVVEVATRNNAGFILVTGDTFEDNAVDRVLVQRVADILGAFAGPVFVISGNHDPLVPGSVWDHPAWKSQSNVSIIRQAIPIPLDGCTLYPSPLFEKYSQKDPTRWIDAGQSNVISIGVAHGTVEGIAQDEPDYPIPRDASKRCGLDYLAIGHWHSTATYNDAAGVPRMAYSGTHETTKFGERDSGNCLLVEIEKRGAVPKLTPIRTGGLTWLSMEEDLKEPGDLARIRQSIEAQTDAAISLLSLNFRGFVSPTDQTELARIDEIVRARFLYGRVDSSALIPRPEDDQWLAKVPAGVMREVAVRLQELASTANIADRPEYATQEVGNRAMLELYRLVEEGQS